MLKKEDLSNGGDKISEAKQKWYTSKEGLKFIDELRRRKGSNNPMFDKSEEIRKRHWTRISDGPKREQIIEQFRKARVKQKFPLKSTSIERIVRDELKRLNIEFVTNYPLLDICQPDIILPDHKIAIQCDGDWWHANPLFYSHHSLTAIQRNNIKRDRFQDEILRKNGWYVIRFWESEIKGNISACIHRIKALTKNNKERSK